MFDFPSLTISVFHSFSRGNFREIFFRFSRFFSSQDFLLFFLNFFDDFSLLSLDFLEDFRPSSVTSQRRKITEKNQLSL